MIILSGVLVVVAIGLLIAGIVTGNSGTEVMGLDGLNLIYVSIGVSIVSALFLAIGVFLRRKELFGSPATGATGSAARAGKRGKAGKAATTQTASGEQTAATSGGTSGGTSIQPAGSHTPGFDIDTADLAAMTPTAADVPATAVVYVVSGRRRYHIDSCRQLAGRSKEELTFEEAREEGFSPCTACMPDTALAARAATGDLVTTDKPDAEPAEDTDSAAASEDEFGSVGRSHRQSNGSVGSVTPVQRQALEDLTDDDEPAAPVAEPTDLTDPTDLAGEGPRGAAERGYGGAVPAVDMAPDEGADAETAVQPATDEPGPAEDAMSGSTDAGADVPPQATRPLAVTEDAAAKGAADAGSTAGGSATADDGGPQVRILSGTKRYHRPDCALIEDIGDDADDLESLSRAEAKARGCTPCLVCQPDREPATRD